MSCEQCADLDRQLSEIHAEASRLRKVIASIEVALGGLYLEKPRRPRGQEFCAYGALIALAAAGKSMSLEEVSRQIGHADDYLLRVCRGKLRLVRAAASAIGAVLGLDLQSYVTRPDRFRRDACVSAAPPQPELPAQMRLDEKPVTFGATLGKVL